LARVWDEGPDPGALSPAQIERLRPLAAHTDRNSDAEYAFYRLHARFQRYAEDLLFADDRLLAFLPWTAATTDGRRDRLRRWLAPGGRSPVEGALVVTDRYVLLLRDDAELVDGYLSWGYVCRLTAPERLDSVVIEDVASGCLRLRLCLASAGSREDIVLALPPAVAGEVRRLASLLAGFIPRPDDARLRRPGTIRRTPRLPLPFPPTGTRRPPRRPDPLVPPAQVVILEQELAALLARFPAPLGVPRRVWATAVVSGDDDPLLVAVTQAHVLLVPPPGRAAPQAHPIASITSVELRRSVLGTHLGWIGGSADAMGEPTVVAFPAVAADSCLEIFAALRQALTLLPVEADGPDTAEPDGRGDPWDQGNDQGGG